jgi:circadian clock protein KaiB
VNASASYRFRLYVAGTSAHSALAVRNLHALCRDYLPDRHEIEIVDVLRTPDRALRDSILVTPTLVKLAPGPVGRLLGNLGNTATVTAALGLNPPA